MVQKAKLKFFSLFSIIIGFFSTYLITPLKNKMDSGESEVGFRLIRMARPQSAVRAAAPQPLSGTFEVKPSSPAYNIQKLTVIRANGQPTTIQRNVDVSAFESWLNSKGYQAQDFSPDGLEEAYTEFRLEQISSQLDRIETLLNR
jgi:hypothetical protein